MKKIFILAMALLGCYTAYAADFEKKTFTANDGSTLLYRQLSPDPKRNRYPLILFLHGAGERGNDNQAQLTHGADLFMNPVNLEKYPTYVLFPQCPKETTWAFDVEQRWDLKPWEIPSDSPQSSMITLLVEFILDFISAHPDVDTKRIYIIGLSMGAIAAYDMVSRYPDLFAAAVPICGAVNPEKVKKAASVKFSIYHGGKDDTVPVECSREAYISLKAAGAKVRYKEFVGCGHGSWNPAFNEPDFLPWLFKQHK